MKEFSWIKWIDGNHKFQESLWELLTPKVKKDLFNRLDSEVILK